MEIGIKDAVAKAEALARDSLGPERTADIRLEEIYSSTVDGRPVWLITLSSASIPPVLARAVGVDFEREYKVFTVAKDNGEVLSMKIRLLAVPSHCCYCSVHEIARQALFSFCGTWDWYSRVGSAPRFGGSG